MSAISTVCSLLGLLAAAGVTCVSGLANLAGEGDAGATCVSGLANLAGEGNAGATCVSGLANLAGEGDAGDGLYPGDVVVDEDLTAGIPQLTPGQRSEGQDSNLKMERNMLITHFDIIFLPSLYNFSAQEEKLHKMRENSTFTKVLNQH